MTFHNIYNWTANYTMIIFAPLVSALKSVQSLRSRAIEVFKSSQGSCLERFRGRIHLATEAGLTKQGRLGNF